MELYMGWAPPEDFNPAGYHHNTIKPVQDLKPTI